MTLWDHKTPVRNIALVSIFASLLGVMVFGYANPDQFAVMSSSVISYIIPEQEIPPAPKTPVHNIDASVLARQDFILLHDTLPSHTAQVMVTSWPKVSATHAARMSVLNPHDGKNLILAWDALPQGLDGALTMVRTDLINTATSPMRTPISLGATRFTDSTVSPGASYSYELRYAPLSAEEFAISPELIIRVADALPPVAPVSVRALVESTAVRISWDNVRSSDFSYWRLWRTDASGLTVLIADRLVNPTFTDNSVALGVAYTYAVTAVDTSGNESARPGAPTVNSGITAPTL